MSIIMGKRSIKLLIFLKSVDGGTGTWLYNLLKLRSYFIKEEIEIFPIVLEKPSYREMEREEIAFLREKNFYPENYTLSFKNIINFYQEMFWLKGKITKIQPDIVISSDVHCNLISALVKLLFKNNLKLILTTHIDLKNTIYHKSSKALNTLLKKAIYFFYNQANIVECDSEELRRNLIYEFNIKRLTVTIYNGALFHLKNQLGNRRTGEEKNIITIARLVEQKDHFTLIKAFYLVQKEIPQARLWILSDGPLKEKLIRFVQKLKLQQKVKFFGWVENIYYYLNKADVFVLSSKREGFAYVLLEAMSRGLPIVSTDTPYGPSEILDKGKYGILIPVGDEKALSIALVSLLTDRGLHRSYAEKSLHRSRFFSEEKMLKSYKKIIEDLINKL
jgi:glycosyltransferase involved in cell wall biosynthesis